MDAAPLNVRLVETAKFHAVAEPVSVTVDVPSVTLRILELLELNIFAFTAKFPVLKAPLVTVIVLVSVIALPKVQPPPTPLKLTCPGPKLTLFVVTVLPVEVATKLRFEFAVLLNTTPVAAFSQLP